MAQPTPHRSKAWPRAVVALALAGALACGSHVEVVTRSITVNVSADCLAQANLSPMDFGNGSVSFEPVGDFPLSTDGVTVSLKQVGAPVGIPGGTQSLLASIAGSPSFLGAVAMPPAGDVGLFVWPEATPCVMTPKGVPLEMGESLGLVDANHSLVVPVTQPLTIVDLTTGVSQPLTSKLAKARSDATVTPFEGGALIAGGLSPNGDTLDSVEVFRANEGGGPGAIASSFFLQDARRSHGATVLLTGETLLVGGLGQSKAPLDTMETLTDTASTPAPVSLSLALSQPTVARLPDGNVVVGGGFGPSGAASPAIQWFSPDVGQSFCTVQVPTPADAYLLAPSEGDSVVVVAAQTSGQPSTASKVYLATRCSDCSSCPPQLAAPIPAGALTADARLFPSSSGSPLLWTGTKWMRWSPWQGGFGDLRDALGNDVTLGPPQGSAALVPDPGLVLWVAASANVRGLRVDARGPYSTDARISELTVAPDRLPPDVQWQRGPQLANGASAFVTDATFAHVVVDASMTPACHVVLRDELGVPFEIGGADCPLDFHGSASAEVRVERSGGSVSVSVSNAPPATCTGLRADARVAVGWRDATPNETCSVSFNQRLGQPAVSR